MTAPADTDPQAPPTIRMRCSDADRLTVVHRLQEAVGTGVLTLEECTERTEAAYRAKHLDELPPLTADLPAAAPAAPGWRALGSMAAVQAKTSLLGAPSWSAADVRRRRLVLLAGILATLLLIAVITASAVAAAGGPDVGGVGGPGPADGYPYWHGGHWHGPFGGD